MNPLSLKQVEDKANEIRQDVIRMLLHAKSGHSAGSLGMADVFAALYFGGVMKYDPKHPADPSRDRFVLSAGHICPVLYATLAHAGFFPHSELSTLRKLGSRLQGHPHNLALPGVENSSGPLGQGVSQAVGMAYCGKHIDRRNFTVYCVTSDGEQQEGQVWEAAMFAGKNRLDNLIFLLDSNNIQIDGHVSDVMPIEPIMAKYQAFGWMVQEIDGNDAAAIIKAAAAAKEVRMKPSLIICKTVPGKGVDFMEYRPEWHGNPPNLEQAKTALKELRTLGGKIRSEHE
ncbi:MAG: transketolase [Candidatus Saccharibacteria bacterium]